MATVTEEPLSTLGPVSAVNAQAAIEAPKYKRHSDMLAARMPNMVKGAGFALPGGNEPLSNQVEIASRVSESALALRGATIQGHNDKASVVKGLNPDFLNNHSGFQTALSMPSFGDAIGSALAQFAQSLPGAPEVLKNWTTTSPLGSGFVPYDLLAPQLS